MASKNSVEPSDFAKEVIGLYKTLLQAPEHRGASGGPNLAATVDARRVAFGLAAIRRLLDTKLAEIGFNDDFVRSGLLEAYKIIEHLTTGLDHPIAMHIAGLKTAYFRPSRQSKTPLGEQGQMSVVGLVRAYADLKGIGFKPAASTIIEKLQVEGVHLTVETVRRWNSRFRDREEVGPDAYANHFITSGNNDLDAVLQHGLIWCWRWLGVATISTK